MTVNRLENIIKQLQKKGYGENRIFAKTEEGYNSLDSGVKIDKFNNSLSFINGGEEIDSFCEIVIPEIQPKFNLIENHGLVISDSDIEMARKEAERIGINHYKKIGKPIIVCATLLSRCYKSCSLYTKVFESDKEYSLWKNAGFQNLNIVWMESYLVSEKDVL